MNGKLLLILRILFIVALIWNLAALSGYVPGVRLRIGKSGGGRRRWRSKRFSHVASGVAGSWVQNPSQSFMPVGINGANF